MEPQSLQAISSAAAPVVMVSAAGLLSAGIQTQPLHGPRDDRDRGPK